MTTVDACKYLIPLHFSLYLPRNRDYAVLGIQNLGYEEDTMTKNTTKTTKAPKAPKAVKVSRLEGTVPATTETAVLDQATPSPVTTEPVKPTREVAAREDATVYTVTGDLDPKRKGLVVKVHRTAKALGSATAAQVADALVASGEWTSKAVAVVPVRVWLKEFVEKGIATVAGTVAK
jgi:hypothetical protein